METKANVPQPSKGGNNKPQNNGSGSGSHYDRKSAE